MYEGHNTFSETRIQRLLDGSIVVEKGLGVHMQRMLKMSSFFTLAEILSKIFVKKKRMKIGDLIYDHGLTNVNDFKYIMRSLLTRLTPLHSENVD